MVNTASKCGFTPQYRGLENLWRYYRERGLMVLGFPCNQFGSQEPGSPLEIANFAALTTASVSRCSARSTLTAPARTRCSMS
ncbi:hypothetical protein AK51_17705 [Serratia nematodiphila DZ0503SBS1]|nr:hypothetical protein AK51_17705 [Serratia nematodiphila DZ0503SBS1]